MKTDLLNNFVKPPDEYRPIPFWWWVGERLTKERLAWQLDQLREKGVLGVIISYNHRADGSTESGDPALFSEEWWELFAWTVEYCRQHGMKIGIKDYTLINPAMQESGRRTPEMGDAGSLRQVSRLVHGGSEAVMEVEKSTQFLNAWAYPIVSGKIQTTAGQSLSEFVKEGMLRWNVPVGDWQVVLVSVEIHPFDPAHPLAGKKTIETLYGLFEKRCPEEFGKTINLFFQDELNFFEHTPSHFPIYSPRIAAEFRKRKGYEIGPWLPALWHDLGPKTAKVRIDYNDVATALVEENFFRPIFEWCDQRGVMLGQDNHGRGRIGIGHKLYGDYFRTMRWYHAPGTEDPGLKRGAAFKGFKVNSSIAHLYERPRVWNEAFHSSGWGMTTAQIVAGFNEDCAYGATVFNLHGLYYTTRGGWWEWAPPDFHFRQPYWEHCDALSDYVARTSYLLSQGAHRCDVAIVYPITTIEAGLNAAEDEAEQQAFQIGRKLFDAGMDFDYIDFESIERAAVRDGELQVSGERYRVLLFPLMGAVRYSSLEKARDFARKGGVVLFYGCLPTASDRAGSEDAQLDALVREISGGAFLRTHDEVLTTVRERLVRNFVSSVPDVTALHRRIGEQDVYYVFNRDDRAREAELFFRAKGQMELWDAWTGETKPIRSMRVDQNGTHVALHLQPRQAQFIVFSNGVSEIEGRQPAPVISVVPLNGPWDFELKPTLDNRHGDFRQPAFDGFIGAEMRDFRYCEEANAPANWTTAGFDDSGWRKVTYSFGPRFWKIGPFAPGTDTSEAEAFLQRMERLDPALPLTVGGQTLTWTPYEFSLRWGMESDSHTGALHGLKGQVQDEFINVNGSKPGSIFFFWTSVISPEGRTVPFVMGSRAEYHSWLNGEPVLSQPQLAPPKRFGWKFRVEPSPVNEISAKLKAGSNPLLLKVVVPVSGGLRMYAVFDPSERTEELGLPWFRKAEAPRFHYRPGHEWHAGCYRFPAPPGLTGLIITARGKVEAWVDGQPAKVEEVSPGKFRARVGRPNPAVGMVALRVEQRADSYAGDSLPEPVEFICERGQMMPGEWSHNGLEFYSGAAWYRKTFTLTAAQAASSSIVLQLGHVACSAEVQVNGKLAGKKIAPPWCVELAGLVREGTNELAVLVANTLANHYYAGIPTAYLFEGQISAGLLGPVRIEVAEDGQG